ncbi:MAG: GNAT family protein [Anaerolineae bacterium]
MGNSLTFPPIFRGKLVRLAAATAADAESFARWSNDDEYLRLLDDDPIRPMAAGEFTWISDPKPDPNSASFQIRTIVDDKHIGFVVLHTIKWPSQSCMVAIGIGEEEYRGRGYGSEAMNLALNYAFNELNLHRVELIVMAYNTRAIASYEKLGFVREGVKREAVQRFGVRYDVLCYAILRPEWTARQLA